MSLIKCSECNREVSNQALSCPHCGFPFQEKYIDSEKTKKIDVNIEKYELTNKRWKKILVFSVPLLIIGTFLFIVNLMAVIMGGATGQSDNSSAGWFIIGFFSMIIGGISSLIAVIGHWWERG